MVTNKLDTAFLKEKLDRFKDTEAYQDFIQNKDKREGGELFDIFEMFKNVDNMRHDLDTAQMIPLYKEFHKESENIVQYA